MGKSTLNRLELTEKPDGEARDRYKKIFCDSEAVDRLLENRLPRPMKKLLDASCWTWM